MKKLFIFGSTGDLVKRKVLPALRGFKELEIIALGRKSITREGYLSLIQEYKDLNLDYQKISFSKKFVECLKCLEYIEKDKTNYFYISLPPKNIEPTLYLFNQFRKKRYKIKILIEKPFGNNLREAKMLSKKIKKFKLNDHIFLSDHYLFKENFLDIEKSDYKKIKIVSLEKLGVEGREFYDEVGAIKDMIQGHFLNMLFKILPKKYLEKLKVKSLEIKQYPGYQEEIGKKSKTETYAKVILKNKKVEIELETGKKANGKTSYIELDEKRFSLIDESNPYKKIFEDFLSERKEKFPSIKDTLKAWKITEKILKKK